MGQYREGTLYQETKHLPGKEISARIRKDIREASKIGLVSSDWKYSVRLHRYAGGQAIYILIIVPESLKQLWRSAPFAYDDEREREKMVGYWEPLARLLDTKKIVKEIHESYNFYESYFPDDGCASRYFGRVSVICEEYL